MLVLLAGCGGAEFTLAERADVQPPDAADAAEPDASPGEDAALDARPRTDAEDAPDGASDASPSPDAAREAEADARPGCTPLSVSVTCAGGSHKCNPSARQVCAGLHNVAGNETCAALPAACACLETWTCACVMATPPPNPYFSDAGAVGCTDNAVNGPMVFY